MESDSIQDNYLVNSNLPIAIYNGTVVTSDGLYRITNLSIESAKALATQSQLISAIGHQAAAELLSEILQTTIPPNRIQFIQQVGQLAIALKLNQRPPEGTILSKEQMLEVGFTLKLIERIE
jgi:Domain of unknown function (DUF1874).